MYRKYLPWYVDVKEKNICHGCYHDTLFAEDSVVLLNWNVHKNNHHYKWLQDFQSILSAYHPNLITFQEYQTMSRRSILDKQEIYSYGFLPNIHYKQHQYGLLNAAKSKIDAYHALYTKDVEPLIKTPKVTFVSHHTMYNNQRLTLVNVHMINFVKIKKFIAQIKQIEEVCSCDESSLILSGDFNTWSKKRMQILETMRKSVGLEPVLFHHNNHKKRFISNPLDHIFYRGFEQVESHIFGQMHTSDHKPMLVKLRVLS